jgi:cyclic beta-1,2-glucan synthetase
VLSGVADPDHARLAMTAVAENLIRLDERLIRLFTPPFDKGHLHPGYIKGYVPGIRENGGQYTHAATWVVQAFAMLGEGQKALELFDLLNPIHHSTTPSQLERYRVEPYVVVADVYSVSPHVGRGGWTWYTGSAAWLYRVGLETILGFHKRGEQLELDPRIPPDWKSFEIDYRHGSACYHITVTNPNSLEHGVGSVWVDGQMIEGSTISLINDGQTHEVRVEMRADQA